MSDRSFHVNQVRSRCDTRRPGLIARRVELRVTVEEQVRHLRFLRRTTSRADPASKSRKAKMNHGHSVREVFRG